MSMTIIGLVPEGVYLEDIRVSVPYRVAVAIPSYFMNSKDLATALNQRKVFQLQGTLPAGAVFRGQGAVPRATAPSPQRPVQTATPLQIPAPSSTTEAESLHKLKTENAQLAKKLEEQQTLNQGLQQTLLAMSGQLQDIQLVLGELKSKGVTVPVRGYANPAKVPGVEDDIPMFIPSVKRDDVETKISVKGKESVADLSASKSALKQLRKGKKKDV